MCYITTFDKTQSSKKCFQYSFSGTHRDIKNWVSQLNQRCICSGIFRWSSSSEGSFKIVYLRPCKQRRPKNSPSTWVHAESIASFTRCLNTRNYFIWTQHLSTEHTNNTQKALYSSPTSNHSDWLLFIKTKQARGFLLSPIRSHDQHLAVWLTRVIIKNKAKNSTYESILHLHVNHFVS